ncbi:hypothetical protein L1887_29993 [Cichorium endivia]|nr:hypothetical protein L1887_29993 [Cichorium endivia]
MGLYSPIPKWDGQVAKLESTSTMVFMSTIVANMLPSLAYMDNKTLLANVIGVTIAIIIVIVDSCIDHNTNVIRHAREFSIDPTGYVSLLTNNYATITIPSLKQVLKSRCQSMIQRTSNDPHPQDTFNYEKLRQYVATLWFG